MSSHTHTHTTHSSVSTATDSTVLLCAVRSCDFITDTQYTHHTASTLHRTTQAHIDVFMRAALLVIESRPRRALCEHKRARQTNADDAGRRRGRLERRSTVLCSRINRTAHRASARAEHTKCRMRIARDIASCVCVSLSLHMRTSAQSEARRAVRECEAF